jgi:uncharacterized membrane protein
LRKILLSGLLVCFLIGIAFLFFRFLIVDVLASLFRPVILDLTDREYLVIPLTLVLSFLVIFIVGFISTRINFQDFYSRHFRRVPKDLEKGRGALVMFSPGAYYLGIIIKETMMIRANGQNGKYYVLYCPSTPLPWSGLPVIYVEQQKVIPLKLSYGELYSLVGSFGANTPQVINTNFASERSPGAEKLRQTL